MLKYFDCVKYLLWAVQNMHFKVDFLFHLSLCIYVDMQAGLLSEILYAAGWYLIDRVMIPIIRGAFTQLITDLKNRIINLALL